MAKNTPELKAKTTVPNAPSASLGKLEIGTVTIATIQDKNTMSHCIGK